MRKKIIFGFFISALVITFLAAFEYINFIQVRNEMSFLEVSDSIRSKSLQLRRHEKNFFLFPEKATDESLATRNYINQLDDITANIESGEPDKIAGLRNLVAEYRAEFSSIETLIFEITRLLEANKTSYTAYSNVFPLIESDARDKPLQVAGFLERTIGLPADDPQMIKLRQLDLEINKLRDTGENILTASKELDTDARSKADRGIRLSQAAILIFLPLFLVLGLGSLLYSGTDIVKRLKTLTDSVEKISRRYAPGSTVPQKGNGGKDEVDILIKKFNKMNTQLMEWEQEIDEKNRELFQSQKMAAIGTLAAGVAHELNNPLNNINLSAQVLQRQLKEGESPGLKEIVDDIVGQTARVKGIVGNLLEFAREREPQLALVDVEQLVNYAFLQVGKTVDTRRIRFIFDKETENVTINADPHQLERVFVNLFTNAVSAMEGDGQLAVQIRPASGEALEIYVSDTGKGIPEEDREKVFDPFFTKKEKGTGLGLAIAMNTIRKHGGNISVVSEEGMGTVFEIILPRGT